MTQRVEEDFVSLIHPVHRRRGFGFGTHHARRCVGARGRWRAIALPREATRASEEERARRVPGSFPLPDRLSREQRRGGTVEPRRDHAEELGFRRAHQHVDRYGRGTRGEKPPFLEWHQLREDLERTVPRLADARALVEAGRFLAAGRVIESLILERMDAAIGGAPENDWIVDADWQRFVLPWVQGILTMTASLHEDR